MRLLVLSFSAIVVGSASVNAATVFLGDAGIIPVGSEGAILGAGLGAPGSAEVNGGTIITLLPGANLDSTGGPKIDVGDGSTGDLLITGSGTEVRAIGNGTGARAEIGGDFFDAGTGIVNIESGARLLIQEASIAPGALGTQVFLGASGTGTLNLKSGTLDVLSGSSAYFEIGSVGGGAMGSLNAVNGSAINIIGSGVPIDGQNDIIIDVGKDGPSTGSINLIESTMSVSASGNNVMLNLGKPNALGTLSLNDASVSLTGDDVSLKVGNGGLAGASLNNGSSLTMAGANEAILEIGSDGTGSMTIEGGSSVVVDGQVYSRIAVGSNPGSNGSLSILSGSSVLLSGPNAVMDIGDPSPNGSDSSMGVVTISGLGSSLSTDTDILVGKCCDNGSTRGILSVSDGAVVTTPSLTIDSGGILMGDGGMIVGNVYVQRTGLVSPGLSPGWLTIDGNLELGSGSVLELEFLSDTIFDRIITLGTVSASGPFEIVLSFLDGYRPIAGQTWEFLSSASVSDTFLSNANIVVKGLGASSLFLERSDNSAGQFLQVRAEAIAPVPLPPTLVLVLGALFSLFAFRHSKRECECQAEPQVVGGRLAV
ncbi:hypothetical protein [Fuscovulum ytuae]|uniref:Uncharacterized protein n=1 Tax=Fuscovulum ytuae TaxID=3042299 RepID=A0ABY8Q527_9RHOB|nr:hypothetical protein [Fuscovulum sp. YMD61]WGV15954.1 hypothetical protein QF092_17135 [Fuscovulum sp. YMD61]